MPQVQVIQPIQQQPKRLRVAAYARVSSDSEDQLNSLAVQVDYYTHLIQENPNWEFAGIYTDEGITGTSTKHREQFNRLMDDCRAGLIDRVLVKSASRFARNTADALTSVRELKSLGVTVAFEKEGFDTETSNGEMLLSIICAVAQEESLSISQNMKWGIHKRMRTGNYITNATPFGYTQINHQLVPEKNNAMIVNDIFKSYLSGMGINEIAEHLNTIYPKENRKWNPRTIHAILRNEKYIGDSLYQKTYTTDSLPLKRYLNTGQRSKYYALETHEGIISKTDYEKVQNLLAKKSITGEIDRTCVFSKKIYCSICGAICSRKGPPTRGFVWCCRTHLQSKVLCLLKSIREDELQQAFLSIYNRLQCNQKTILEPLVDDLLGLRHLQEQKYKNRLALGEDIQHLAKQKHNLTRIHTLGYIEETQFIERSAAIEQQIREKKQQLSRNDMPNTSEKILQKTRLIQKKLSSTPPLESFDESAFKELVKKVLISNTAIQFELIKRHEVIRKPCSHMKNRYIPFGYQMQNGDSVINTEQAATVQHIFYAYTEGQSFKEIAEYLTTSGTAYHFSDNNWNKNIVARILANEIYCGAKGYPAIISKEVYSQAASIRSNKTVTYSAVLKPFRSDMQCACCGERLYWRPRTQQWTCRQCGMWSKPMQPENMAQQIVDRLYQIQQHPEIIHNPKEQCNTRSIEVAQLDHEIHTALALPELDADAIIDKILRRAELQFNYCAAGDDDPTTMQIKRACKEFKPTDTFPESFYSSIVSKIILHLDTHIDIKLRNGQTL